MSRFGRKVTEKVMEGLLTLSGLVTSVAVVLIIVFLFTEGWGIFGRPQVEEDTILVVHPANTITELEAHQVKDIYDAKITNWSKLGGPDLDILPFRIDDIAKYFEEEELGENFSLLPQRLTELVARHPGILANYSERYRNTVEAKEIVIERANLNGFLTGEEWYPTATPSPQFGMLPLILGTLWVGIGAILFALPLGLGVAIFMAEMASPRLRSFLKPVVELLAGIPSVVYGFFGLVVLVPAVQRAFGLPTGETGLAGALVLGIMALPTIITIAEDALRAVPRAMKEASLALGASHWQTIKNVMMPYASSGITAAVILGVGRAIGETMAVLMVTGNAAVIPKSYFEPLRTIPATIAAELGEAPYGGLHFQSLFVLGAILFVMTFFINLSFELIGRRRRRK